MRRRDTLGAFLARMKRAQGPPPRKSRPPAPVRTTIPHGTRLLALDVSSAATGWAVLVAGPRLTLDRFGLIKPPASLDAKGRIVRTLNDVREIFDTDETRIDRTVLEWSAGKVHGNMRRRMSGLAVLGQAQGAVWAWTLRLTPTLETVTDIEWTQAQPKPRRAAQVAALFPQYVEWSGFRMHPDGSFTAPKDPGLDVADAIGLGVWRLTHGDTSS